MPPACGLCCPALRTQSLDNPTRRFRLLAASSTRRLTTNTVRAGRHVGPRTEKLTPGRCDGSLTEKPRLALVFVHLARNLGWIGHGGDLVSCACSGLDEAGLAEHGGHAVGDSLWGEFIRA